MQAQPRCCYTASAAWLHQLNRAVLLFVCLFVYLFWKERGTSLLYSVFVIWFVLAFRVLLRQAEWKFQLHAFICSPLACRLREQGYGPIGLHVINLLGTMKREHLNVSWLFRQALSEGLLIYVERITKKKKKERETIKGILERRVCVSLGVHQPHWMGAASQYQEWKPVIPARGRGQGSHSGLQNPGNWIDATFDEELWI